MKSKLKIGLLLESNEIPSWVSHMLEQIVKSGKAEINLIIAKKKIITKNKKNIFSKLYDSRKKLSYIIIQKIDEVLFKPVNDAFEMKPLNQIIGCQKIEVQTIETEFSDRFESEDLDTIKSYELDIIIRLGYKILRGDILNVSKYGVWSYHHGNNKINRGGPAGVWEVIERHEVTGVTLQILNEKLDDGRVLAYSNIPTDANSITRNINDLYWHATSMLPRKISELYDLGDDMFFSKLEVFNSNPYFYDRQLYKTPNNFRIIKYAFLTSFSILSKKIKGLYSFNQWILLYKWSNDEGLSTTLNKFIKIIPPKDRFWADPFIIKRDGKQYVFFEELIYKTNKGHISVFEIDENGNYSEPQIVLEKDYHLSYPFLIEENNNLYMIPETKENCTIEMYRCTNFPLVWELELVLMNNIQAVDSTITKKDNLYWLFANVKVNKGGSSHNELFLYYSENLLSDVWKPHKNNPVISDTYSSRPAGKLFTYKNQLYRPSQNCGKSYGYGLVINKVLKLSIEDYSEEITQFIYPNWDPKLNATHTLNNSNNLTVIDALYKRSKF